MAIATLSLCYNNHNVFTGELRQGQPVPPDISWRRRPPVHAACTSAAFFWHQAGTAQGLSQPLPSPAVEPARAKQRSPVPAVTTPLFALCRRREDAARRGGQGHVPHAGVLARRVPAREAWFGTGTLTIVACVCPLADNGNRARSQACVSLLDGCPSRRHLCVACPGCVDPPFFALQTPDTGHVRRGSHNACPFSLPASATPSSP